MYPVKIFEEADEVNNRLEKFGVTQEELFQVAHKVVAARNNATPLDPSNTPGQFGYIFGTRAIRELFLQKGWEINRSDNIEATYNPETDINIIYQNADSASKEHREPKAISDKGEGSKRMVANSQQVPIFPHLEDENTLPTPNIWFFFVSVVGTDVCAELSCPRTIRNGQFKDFAERIFIIKSGEWDDLNITPNEDEYYDDNFEINVSKK